MAIEIQNAVKAAKMPETIKGTATAKYVLLALADRADAVNAECWPSQDLIAWETELSPSTVKRSIKALSDAGLIQIKTEWRSGRKHNNYRINIQLLHSLRREPLNRSRSDAPALTPEKQTKPANAAKRPRYPAPETEVTADQLPPDEYPNCREAIQILKELNEAGHNFYTGPLRWSEWDSCEGAITLAISEAYIELPDFLTGWAIYRAQGFKKAPSLPNIFPETMNGIEMEDAMLHLGEDFDARINGYK